MMICDNHTAAAQAFAPLVAAVDRTLPRRLDERGEALLDSLRGADSADFDRVWLGQQIATHTEALMLHRGFSANRAHPELAAHARSVLGPVTRRRQDATRVKAARQ